MKSNQHNYIIFSPDEKYSFVSKNSHAAGYAYLSWMTGYLKANYPDEFICAILNTEIERANHDKIEMIEKDVKENMGIKILPKSINECGLQYKIVRKKSIASQIPATEIRPSIICKGVGPIAAEAISKVQPFKDLTDFAKRTSSAVDATVLEALIDNGYLKGGKGKESKTELLKRFAMIREAAKRASKEGTPDIDMFDDDK